MKGINKAIVAGNAAADPDYRITNGGQAVCSLTLASNESYTDANGQKQDRVEWFRLIFWGKLADVVNQYIKKGSALYAEGKIRTRSYDDANGVKKYVTEIVVNELVMLPSGNQNNGQNNGQNYGNGGAPANYGNNGNGGRQNWNGGQNNGQNNGNYNRGYNGGNYQQGNNAGNYNRGNASASNGGNYGNGGNAPTPANNMPPPDNNEPMPF
jgi:single stranded DNA-binding protein (ssb)